MKTKKKKRVTPTQSNNSSFYFKQFFYWSYEAYGKENTVYFPMHVYCLR